jgi:hypothetical protein
MIPSMPPPTLSLCRAVQESTFLVASILVLVMGMVFASQSFQHDSTAYVLLNVITAVVILGSTGSFAVLLAFEVYRSIRVCACACVPRCAHPLTQVAQRSRVQPWVRVRVKRGGAAGVA